MVGTVGTRAKNRDCPDQIGTVGRPGLSFTGPRDNLRLSPGPVSSGQLELPCHFNSSQRLISLTSVGGLNCVEKPRSYVTYQHPVVGRPKKKILFPVERVGF